VQDDRVVGGSFHRRSPGPDVAAILGLSWCAQLPLNALNRRAGRYRLNRLAHFEVLCRLLGTVVDDFILNNLPFVEGVQAGLLDR
jgi:hypothetical protein